MRRMYSEQELTNVIKKVFEEELESGALDESVADAVDAYLVEHPVDITALEGQDVSLNSLDADGLITGGEIVEKMSGYSFNKGSSSDDTTLSFVYAGIVKNGNKLTCVIAVNITKINQENGKFLGQFNLPASVASQLYTTLIGDAQFLSLNSIDVFDEDYTKKNVTVDCKKSGNAINFNLSTTQPLVANKRTYLRIEQTFLLSENLAS